MEPTIQTFSGRHPLELRVPPLLVAFLFGIAGWLVAKGTAALAIDAVTRGAFAAGLLLVGLSCSVFGVVSFRRARTTVNPMKPDATSALVTSGIYRVTRNPMYLGFLFFLLAEIAWLASSVATRCGSI